MRSGRSRTIQRTTFSTLAPVSQTPLVIQRPELGSTNQRTAEIRGCCCLLQWGRSLPSRLQPPGVHSTPNGTYTGNAFLGRAIGSIVVDPTNASHLYVSSARGVRGVSSVTGGGTTNPPPPRPPFGLFESTDGGATFSFIWDGGDTCPAVCDGTNPKATIRGVNKVQLDPGYNGTTNKIVYAGAFGPQDVGGSGGVWRSTDGGVIWTQIKAALTTAATTDRARIRRNTDYRWVHAHVCG